MAEISYFNILEELKRILLTDSRTQIIGNSKIHVSIEGDIPATSDTSPYVDLSLDAWSMPKDEEMIGGGSRSFNTELTIKLSLVVFSLEKKNSAELRDRLFRKVREVLKNNRTINDTILISWFGSGDFTSGKGSNDFFQGINFELICEIRE